VPSYSHAKISHLEAVAVIVGAEPPAHLMPAQNVRVREPVPSWQTLSSRCETPVTVGAVGVARVVLAIESVSVWIFPVVQSIVVVELSVTAFEVRDRTFRLVGVVVLTREPVSVILESAGAVPAPPPFVSLFAERTALEEMADEDDA